MSASTFKLSGPVPGRLKPYMRHGCVTLAFEGEPGAEMVAISASEAEIMDPCIDFYLERASAYVGFVWVIPPSEAAAGTPGSIEEKENTKLPASLPPGFIVDPRNGTVVEVERISPLGKMEIGNYQPPAKVRAATAL